MEKWGIRHPQQKEGGPWQWKNKSHEKVRLSFTTKKKIRQQLCTIKCYERTTGGVMKEDSR